MAAYCAVCGQESETHRRSVWRLIGALFEEIVSFDSRILRTALALIARPGELSLAFHQGRSRRYVPALRLYLFVSVIFFLALSATGLAIVQFQAIATPASVVTDAAGHSFIIVKGAPPQPIAAWKAKEPGQHFNISTQTLFFTPLNAVHSQMPAIASARLIRDLHRSAYSQANGGWGPWIKAHVLRVIEAVVADPAAVNGPLTQWIPRVLFILLPLYALILAAFYWRQRRAYLFIDHLVFSLNMHSLVFVVILAAVALAQWAPGGAVAWAALAAIGLYLLLAMKRFYSQGWFITGVKFVAVAFVYTVFFLMPAVGAVVVVSLLDV
jgi:hypothetical protein